MSRLIILTEGTTNAIDAKTANCVVRYRPKDVAAIFDRELAGRTCGEVLGVGGDIPVIGDLGAVDADTLLIGIAPAGGRLPDSWRAILIDAIDRGMRIINGLHIFLADDPELGAKAEARGVEIVDVRRPRPGLTVSRDEARRAPCFRVHTVGHDCSVGKMLVAVELTNELRRRGRRAKFIATGQTGIVIAGSGVPIDAVVSDFVAGAIEAEVLAAADEEIVVVEGQGSLYHPMYSGVTLGLLHGCAPQALVFCIDATRDRIRHCDLPTPQIDHAIATYERMARILVPSARVVAVAVNTSALDAARARDAVDAAARTSGLPATDPIRYGVAVLADAVLACEASERESAGSGVERSG